MEANAKIIQMKNLKIKVLDDDKVISKFEKIGWSDVGTAAMVCKKLTIYIFLLIEWARFTKPKRYFANASLHQKTTSHQKASLGLKGSLRQKSAILPRNVIKLVYIVMFCEVTLFSGLRTSGPGDGVTCQSYC